ncbi:RNA polymerase sigma factor [Telluribacter humicola]|uniref:RNA polymerase sigma factor n=1 Tax=Telluribacter humicola TaxID=1720261 RepID=UPI001A965F5E|nr:sigma-70 family RNA polymerase sigma factor [Telluribacter humicola]
MYLTPEEHLSLWNDFRSGNTKAYAKIYELFAADLYRYGYNLVRNKQLVEDCLHELFLHLHHQKHKLSPTNNIRFYLYRALRNRLLDSIQKQNKFTSEETTFNQAEFTVQSFESQWIEEQVLVHQKQMVVTALNKLPKRQKEILYLVYMKGLSHQEVAEVMNISMKSVYNTLNIALKTLRDYVNISFLKEGVLGVSLGSLVNLFFLPLN